MADFSAVLTPPAALPTTRAPSATTTSVARRLVPPYLVILGLAAGLAAKIGDGAWQWSSDLGTYPAVWIFAGVAIGRFSHSAVSAATRVVTFSVAVLASYYAWSVWVLEYGVGTYPTLWLGVAMTLAPALGVLAWLGSTQRIPAWFIAGPVAALILVEGPLRQYWNEITIGLPPGFPFHPVQAIVDVALAVAVIGLLSRCRTDWAKAVAFTVPMILIAEPLLDVARTVARI